MTRKELNDWLFQAVKDNDIEEVKKAIEAGAEVNATDEDGATPLHLAAFHGHTEISGFIKYWGSK